MSETSSSRGGAGNRARRRLAIAYGVTALLLGASAVLVMLSVLLAPQGGLVGRARVLLARVQPAEERQPDRGPSAASEERGDQEQQPDAVVLAGKDGLSFSPERVEITSGQTVLWRNAGFDIHTVTADPEKAISDRHVLLPPGAETFDSGRFSPGETYSRTFTVPGLYRYFCIPHEATGMIGEIEVVE